MIVEMGLRVACTDLHRQLEAGSRSAVRGNGHAESQCMEMGFEASDSGLSGSESIR